MSNMADSIVAAETRPVALRVRPDLRFELNHYQGQASWIVKDPIGLKYFRLAEEEYTALQMLDGKTSLQQIKTELERKFPPWIVEYSELQSLLGMFHRSGLVLSDRDGQGRQLFERRRKQRRQQMLSKLASILWVRLPGVDPEEFLTWLHPKVRWVFTKWGLLATCLLASTAGLLVLMHFNEFSQRLPSFHQFFGPANIAWLMIALVLSKVLHELGHGLACKHFGGECHEIGVMFLVFTPCLYCDTSDSWMLGNRWHRAAIGAAGMYVEVILASICTFIWWNTEPGVIHYVALSTMFVCSVSTLMFNSNPLLRFDGYYILSDILEIPNLAQKSRAAMIALLRVWCLGLPWDDRLNLPPRRRLAFALYSVASVAYRWMVLIFILWFLSKVFEPYGLQPIGHILIAMSLFGIIAMPAWQIHRFFRVPGRMHQVKKVRLLATICLVTMVVLAIVYVPVPHRVFTAFVVQPRDADHVYVEVPGVLRQVSVQPGDYVDAGTTLAVLDNLEKQFQIEELRGEQLRLKQELENLSRLEKYSDIAAQLPELRQKLRNVNLQIAQWERDLQRLKLNAKSEGFVLPPRERPEPPASPQQLPSWSGTPLDEINAEAWLEAGELFCMIGDPDRMEAVLIIDQSDIEFVESDQLVDIKFDEYPGKTFQGRIDEIAKSDLAVAPPELSNKAEGKLSTETDPSGGERPMNVSYQATVPLEDIDSRVLSGFRGRAKIHTGTRTLGQIIWRGLLETFRFG